MNKGERLDILLSTSNSAFNHAMQELIWERTANKPRGTIIPDEGIIEYMELLHKAFFFCLSNSKTPYSCIAYLSELAEDDEILLSLIDSILHLISRCDEEEEKKLLILFGQLVDLRNELAPWEEDERVKSISEAIDNPLWDIFVRPPLSLNSLTVQPNEDDSLTNRQRVLQHFYEGGKMPARNDKAYNDYNIFCTPSKRFAYPDTSQSKLKYLIRDIEKILPYLSVKAKKQAETELNTLKLRQTIEK